MSQTEDAKLYGQMGTALHNGTMVALYRDYATVYRCPNPTCGKPLNMYRATGDQISVDYPFAATKPLIEQAACNECGIPVMKRHGFIVGTDFWEADLARAGIAVVIAPRKPLPTIPVTPDKLVHLSRVIADWMRADPDQLSKLASMLLEEANLRELAALCQPVPYDAGSVMRRRYHVRLDARTMAITVPAPMDGIPYAELVMMMDWGIDSVRNAADDRSFFVFTVPIENASQLDRILQMFDRHHYVAVAGRDNL